MQSEDSFSFLKDIYRMITFFVFVFYSTLVLVFLAILIRLK